MGRPSSKRYSARRPGKRERARVKSLRGGRGSHFAHVPGVGHVALTAGRKHLRRFSRWVWKATLPAKVFMGTGAPHLGGEPEKPKAGDGPSRAGMV